VNLFVGLVGPVTVLSAFERKAHFLIKRHVTQGTVM